MFPENYAAEQINLYSKIGDLVYDPFSGRGTTLLQALLMERHALAGDLNPVAYCISSAKAGNLSLDNILTKIELLETEYQFFPRQNLEEERKALPAFFRRAFYSTTLREILFLRKKLDWKNDPCERFIAALTLGSLHGDLKSHSYLSNQMPRTVSLKPGYSLRYWHEHNLWPHKRSTFNILKLKARYRLSGELPRLTGNVALVDVRKAASVFSSMAGKVNLIVTSPPYLDVTNYEEDQWLRLWFLGGYPYPTYSQLSLDDRHTRRENYFKFLCEAWRGIGPLLDKDAVLACRMGGKNLTEVEITDLLTSSLKTSFKNVRLIKKPVRSEIKKKQTQSFCPPRPGCSFEIDHSFILHQYISA
jgi:hypothetical protein